MNEPSVRNSAENTSSTVIKDFNIGLSDMPVSIRINSAKDIVEARQKGRVMTHEMGCSSTQTTLVSTVISELSRNILLYAGEGEIEISRELGDNRSGLRIIARDHGPGIENISLAMTQGYSSSGGLGLGLPGVKQIVHRFDINSQPGEGVTVDVTLWLVLR